MSEENKVAIVILNWNGENMLAQYMNTLLEYSRRSATVYVADNASTDQSVTFLQKHYPEVNIIQLDKNWGRRGDTSLVDTYDRVHG